MSDAATFRYVGVDLDPTTSTVTCRFALGDDDFVETAVLPGGDLARPGVAEAAELYCLLAGVSYFKTRAPSTHRSRAPGHHRRRALLPHHLLPRRAG